ncbi:hypothetical protein HMPREF0208_03257 [Citrobacter koseri]|nr:hypothetical protein HMPREF0208_03257 [Citrobacter koseri]
MKPPACRRLRLIFTISPRCARSYPRHACPLCVVVFMHLHDISKSPPVLAGLSKNDPQTIMRFHAA